LAPGIGLLIQANPPLIAMRWIAGPAACRMRHIHSIPTGATMELAQWRAGALFLALTLAVLAPANAADADAALVKTVTELDTKVFDAYNRCDLASFESYFIPAVEFYHDNAGLMSGRQAVVESTRKFICHKVQRKLIPNSLKIYPIKDYGAIEVGRHRFCHVENGKDDCGTFSFVHILPRTKAGWKISRVISYGH